jgi:hypothetical protein
MPTNANTFNSRVTSEALEAKFRQVFPSQGGAELVQDLFASGVIQPVVDFSNVAEGSVLPQNLQTAWDFSTGVASRTAGDGTNTEISNTGFWLLSWNATIRVDTTNSFVQLRITDGLTNKTIFNLIGNGVADSEIVNSETQVVFLRAGDSLISTMGTVGCRLNVVYRQIADVYGNLVNPLGFTFS